MTLQNRIETTALVFAVLTCIAIFSYPKLFNISYQLDPSKKYQLSLDGDIYSGGNSEAEWISITESFHWQCDVGDGIQYPYCSFKLNMSDPDNGLGVDLTNFESVTIYYDFQGNPGDTFRFHLRTHHTGITKFNDQGSFKYNEIEIKPERDGSPFTFLLSDLHTPTWWSLEKNLTIEQTRPSFADVMLVEIVTGTNTSLGTKTFNIEKIVFNGKRFSQANFYLAIIILWLTFLFVIFAVRLYQLNLAFNLAQAEKKTLSDIANRDQLTQLLNRRAIDKLFDKLDFQWRTKRTPYSLIVLDIDHFKRINDQFGHSVGDDILKLFANLLSSNTRNQDYVGRWGGEEFIILLQETDLHQAAISAEKFRKIIAEASWPEGLKITASFGVSSAKGDFMADQIFTFADSALYRAKASGRNQVARSDQLSSL